MKEKGFLERTIDSIFDIEKHKIFLIAVLILGFMLRLFAAINLSVYADDMHFVTHALGFLESGKLETYDQSSGLWFLFTSLMYNLLGPTQLASRMAALVFGSLSIFAVYLLSREFFDEKISLMASFVLAISVFHIKSTIAEMDVMTMFFVIFGMFLFIKATKKDSINYFAFAGILFGLAIYTKVYPLLFIPSMIIYYAYSKKISSSRKWSSLKKWNSKDFKFLIIFLLVIFLFAIPALAHNFILYQEKGFLDLQFTRTLDLGKNNSAQYYSWDAQFSAKNDWKGLVFGSSTNYGSKTPTLLASFMFFAKNDPIVFILMFLGILSFFIFKIEKSYLVFFLSSILFVWPFLSSIIMLPKHFIFFTILSAPICAVGIISTIKKINNLSKKENTKLVLSLLFIASIIFLAFPVHNKPYYAESSVAAMMDFKESQTSSNSLLVVDSRIYRGRTNWIAQERPYLEGMQFIELANQQDSLPGRVVTAEIYYFECVQDDCGWGTIKDQPEFNASQESLTAFFKNQGTLVKTIYEPNPNEPYFPLISSKDESVRIYKLTAPIKESILIFALQPKNWFLYDIGYKNRDDQFDSLELESFGTGLLYKFARTISLSSLILAFISIIYLIYILKNEKVINNSPSI